MKATKAVDVDDNEMITEVLGSSIVADIGTFGRTWKINSTTTGPATPDGKMTDSGANCCMTNNWKLLEEIVQLEQPMKIGMAVNGDKEDITFTLCTHVGKLPIYSDDGNVVKVECFYNPHASDTIISPQAIIDSSADFNTWIQVGRKRGKAGRLRLMGDTKTLTMTLQQQNGLYYCNALKYNIHHLNMEPWIESNALAEEFGVDVEPVLPQVTHMTQVPKRHPPPTTRFQPATKAKVLESETWYLRMGGCNEEQLELLSKHAIGVPKHFEFHPFRFIDFKEHARIRKQPAGQNPLRVSSRAKRFYIDFGFMRASTEDFSKPNAKTDRVVESFDGYTSYVLVVDEKTKHSWIFLTKSKSPPIELVSIFMKQFGNEDGGVIRVDQGGELARSEEFRTTMLKDYQYVIEPTGADSPSQNGQVERYNHTLATIVRTLLYGANLPAKYWSVAAVHAVYLMNRRVHSALHMTPYEAWWDFKPDVSAMRLFGSRVCVKVTGKRRAKLDRHDFNGIFVGYTATDDNIRYIDVDTGIVKTCHHAVFDEAWYLQPARPPAAQLLFDMGMEVDNEEQVPAPPAQPRQPAPWPALSDKALSRVPKSAKNIPIPLRLSAAPTQKEVTARAATLQQTPYEGTWLDPMLCKTDIIKDMMLDKREVFDQVYVSPTPYNNSFEEHIDISRWTTEDGQPAAGMRMIQVGDRVFLAGMAPSTPAARIPRWRSRCRGAWIIKVNDTVVHSVQEVYDAVKKAKQQQHKKLVVLMAHSEIKDGLTHDGIPQVNVDQMNPQFFLNFDALEKQRIPVVATGGVLNYVFSKLTRGKLLKQTDWDEWRQSEFLQLDQYESQMMFGTPVKVEDYSNVFYLVWSYAIKDLDNRKKARCTCDGSSRGGKVRVLDHTYANCVDHTASRLFYAIAAAENLIIFGADVSNAFSEAPPPKQGFYIQPDQAFRDWWVAKGNGEIPAGHVIPVMRAMQGHPESPRLWEKWCDKMVKDLKFSPTTHEPCLYHGFIKGHKCYFKRQVDDFELAAPNHEIANFFYDEVDDFLTMPIKRQGIVTLFNGIDILQSRQYIKISAETYIEKMGAKYLSEWGKDFLQVAERPLPIPTNEAFLKAFGKAEGDPDPQAQAKLKKAFKFGYRNGIGELIYAMVTCRPDISTAVVRCAQVSACPAEIHYNAVKHAIKYLYATRKDGIYFWRAKPLMSLPDHPLPAPSTALHGPIPEDAKRPSKDVLEAYGYVDSDWAACARTRRSLTGIVIQMAGGTVAYKTKLQVTVAMSSTEAEFMAACDAGKMILFIRSILWDLGIPQQAASVLFEDNDACTAMANAQKPTTRTRHMDIRYFALSEWVERDLMVLERIHTAVNVADHMTKLLDRTLFYRHVDYLMGHIPPAYSPCHEKYSGVPNTTLDDLAVALDDLVLKPEHAAAAKCTINYYPWMDVVGRDALFQPNLGQYPHWIVGGC
jgi:KUP system potassium uptake protein